MSASVCDVPKTKTEDTISTIPVNGAPPGEKQTLVTKPKIVKIPKTSSIQSKPVSKIPGTKMGNQQGSDSGKNNSKKKAQTKRGSKKSTEKSDGSQKKVKTLPATGKETPPSPNKIALEKPPVQHASGASALETSTTSDVFSEAVDHIEEPVQSVSAEKTKRRESSSGDNISFQSFATPLSTPQIHRSKQKSPTCSPVDRVDELGKSIQRTIIERFSSNSPEPLSTEVMPPSAHEITGLPQMAVCNVANDQDKSGTSTGQLQPEAQTATNRCTSKICPLQEDLNKVSLVDDRDISNGKVCDPHLTSKPISENETEAVNICNPERLVDSKAIKKESEAAKGLTVDNSSEPSKLTDCSTNSTDVSTDPDIFREEAVKLSESVLEQKCLESDTSTLQPAVERCSSDLNISTQSNIGAKDSINEEAGVKSAEKESDVIYIDNGSDLSTLTESCSSEVKQETTINDKESIVVESLVNRPNVSANGESLLENGKSGLTPLFISESDLATSEDNVQSITSGCETKHTFTEQTSNSVTSSTQILKHKDSPTDKKSTTVPKSECRKSFTNDPIIDNLLMLIKQTLEADDTDYKCDVSTRNTSDFKQLPSEKGKGANIVQTETDGSMFPSADADEDKTLTPSDLDEFNRLKASAYSDTDFIGNVDDDTLTPEDMAEFSRIKKNVLKPESGTENQTENDEEFSYSSMDKYDLSSGETTEDSVIERPVLKASALAATPEEECRNPPVTNSVSSSSLGGEVKLDVDPPPIKESTDFSNPDEPQVEVRKRSLTEEEIRREIRKFMIPEMKEALPKTGGMNRMLDDLHDITPTSEHYPDLEEGDGAVSPEYGISSGLRSRTSITSSELDISEHRDDVSTDSMYADDEDDSSSEVLFCKTYTEPERGTEVLVSCTVVNSNLKKKKTCSSDEFWAESSAAEDAYQEVELAADAVNKHFTHARSQMQDIQHHLQALRHQMQHMEKQVVKTYTLPSTDEYDFEEVERRAITD